MDLSKVKQSNKSLFVNQHWGPDGLLVLPLTLDYVKIIKIMRITKVEQTWTKNLLDRIHSLLKSILRNGLHYRAKSALGKFFWHLVNFYLFMFLSQSLKLKS